MYRSSNFISVTDMRKDISQIMEALKIDKQKIIFKNNKPTAVLVDFEMFEKITDEYGVLYTQADASEVQAIHDYEQKESSDWVDAQDFFKDLKNA